MTALHIRKLKAVGAVPTEFWCCKVLRQTCFVLVLANNNATESHYLYSPRIACSKVSKVQSFCSSYDTIPLSGLTKYPETRNQLLKPFNSFEQCFTVPFCNNYWCTSLQITALTYNITMLWEMNYVPELWNILCILISHHHLTQPQHTLELSHSKFTTIKTHNRTKF